MTALEVRNLSKSYPLSDSQWTRLRHALRRGRGGGDQGIWALRDVSFTVAKGEAFGIVGANGSGKSTLLQIVAGILSPTRGEVEVHGRMSALLELGSGFAPEFTGRQNVYLNASILGLSRDEIDGRFGVIERFAAIGEFMDQPIRTWSTGMVLRLAFAVAAHVEPEILIVDEALAVGDIAFRQRCMRRIHEVRAAGTTILFVSHDTGDVKALCERCLWLDNGVVRALGVSDEVVAAYLSAIMEREGRRERLREAETKLQREAAAAFRVEAERPEDLPAVTGTHRYGSRNAEVSGAAMVTPRGDRVRKWAPRESVVLRIGFRILALLPDPIVGFLVRNEKGETIFGSNTARENYPLPEMEPGESHVVDFHWAMPELAAGRYFVSIAVSAGTVERFEVCDYVEDAIVLEGSAGTAPEAGYLKLKCAAVAVIERSPADSGEAR